MYEYLIWTYSIFLSSAIVNVQHKIQLEAQESLSGVDCQKVSFEGVSVFSFLHYTASCGPSMNPAE